MTTATDDGLTWIKEKTIDDVSDKIDAVAIGTGKNESTGASQLGNEVYRGDTEQTNVNIVDLTDDEYEARISVTGGTEVAAGTKITEIGIFAGGAGGGGTLIVIDQFDYIKVEAGHTERFETPIDYTR